MGETAHESQVAGHKASRQEAGHAGQATYLPWRPHSCCEGPAAVFKKRAAAHPRQTCLLPAPSGSPRGRREKQRLTVTTYQASPALGRAGPPGGTRARSPLCHGAGRGVPRLSPLIYHPPTVPRLSRKPWAHRSEEPCAPADEGSHREAPGHSARVTGMGQGRRGVADCTSEVLFISLLIASNFLLTLLHLP